MKKYTLLFLFCVSQSFAQVNLMGIRYTEENSAFSIVKWNTATPEIEEAFPIDIPTYLLGSSLFDAKRSAYYFRAASQLNAFKTDNNTLVALHDETSFNSATEIDMSNGTIYTVFPQGQIPATTNPDSPYFSLVKLNLEDNTMIELGTLEEPITAIALSEGTCYDSDNGDYYFVGYDSNLQLSMYKMNTESISFSYEKIVLPLEDITYYLSGLYYDMQADNIIAIKTTFNEVTALTTREIIQISPLDGTFTTLYTFNDLLTIQNGSTTFDQTTRTYILVTIDENFTRTLFEYNTISNTATTSILPVNVGEIEADNTSFSVQRYSSLGGEVYVGNPIKVYPIPSQNEITIETGLNKKSSVSILSLDGKVCYAKDFNGNTITLSIATIASGIYMLKIEDEVGVITKRIIKQ
ncbi:MAG: hypothetical protein RL427_277 [Bacteroidota bacterium]|jgi:hypothetical protein